MDTSETQDLCVLFVDDELNILHALEREMRGWARQNQLSILTADSGALALEVLRKNPKQIALVISDLKMPGMLGSDLLLQIKKEWPDIVTMLLTGYSETQEVMKAVQAGIFSYILKPWESDYLQAELSKALVVYKTQRQNEAYKTLMEEELRWAGEMQRALLRPALVKTEGVEFRVSYHPVEGLYCGGDYYDVINLPNERYLMLLGDVAGHGVKAAFITGILKAVIYSEYVRNALYSTFSPAAFLSWLNDRMNFELRQTSGLILSFLAIVLDRKNGTIVYSNAGHNKPLHISGSRLSELPVSGPAIGMKKTVMYVDNSGRLLPGDVVLAYTDGLTEVGGATGESGHDFMVKLFSSTPYSTDYHSKLMQSALQLAGQKTFQDDVTLLSAKLL